MNKNIFLRALADAKRGSAADCTPGMTAHCMPSRRAPAGADVQCRIRPKAACAACPEAVQPPAPTLTAPVAGGCHTRVVEARRLVPDHEVCTRPFSSPRARPNCVQTWRLSEHYREHVKNCESARMLVARSRSPRLSRCARSGRCAMSTARPITKDAASAAKAEIILLIASLDALKPKLLAAMRRYWEHSPGNHTPAKADFPAVVQTANWMITDKIARQAIQASKA